MRLYHILCDLVANRHEAAISVNFTLDNGTSLCPVERRTKYEREFWLESCQHDGYHINATVKRGDVFGLSADEQERFMEYLSTYKK